MPEPRADEARIAEVLSKHPAEALAYHARCGPSCREEFYYGEDGDDWEDRWAAHVAEVVAGALAPDIDKVAEAIWYEDRPHWASPKHWAWTDVSDPHKGVYRRMARAAVAAMGFGTS